jgi:2-oxoglutarate ferredoxin oxidoreductase subunit alpha
VIKTAVAELLAEGHEVAHAHLRYLRPFPRNLGQLLRNYETVLIPEINNGQLIKIIRDQYLVDAKAFNKIMGVPITKAEITEAIKAWL